MSKFNKLSPATRITAAVSLALALSAPFAAQAAGTLVSAPLRKDMAYDAQRGTLIISNGDQLVRYALASQSYLPPLVLGGKLMGMDISPDGTTLAVADGSYDAATLWVHLVDLQTNAVEKVSFPLDFYEAGSFTVAFADNNRLLISSQFAGSGWVPLRAYDRNSKVTTKLGSVRQNTMLAASADRSVVVYAENNSSAGDYGRLLTSPGAVLEKLGSTGSYLYEIGVSRDGKQVTVPSYMGATVHELLAGSKRTLGAYAGAQPVGLAYHPKADRVFYTWATTRKVMEYDSASMTVVAEHDLENTFDHPGNHAFVEGRLKLSPNGSWLFATVEGGVRALRVGNEAPKAASASYVMHEDQPASLTLAGSDGDGDVLRYTLLSTPANLTLTGDAPRLTASPVADFNGSTSFSYTVSDGTASAEAATISVQVMPVNDAPSFSLKTNRVTAPRNGGKRQLRGMVQGVVAGPADEAAQQIGFVLSNSNTALFSLQPSISPQGVLTFASAYGKRGKATVTVLGRDNGGTANGGVDTSAAKTFVIEIY
ncbi:cadherin-like domain-containing protein [Chitinimonas sp. JJ19]|uniref:cadherin-like domain-containing protein n=1 Tax=Chitinimonas sp. JJ19 TaxID=3109352 RepID=UPI003001299C